MTWLPEATYAACSNINHSAVPLTISASTASLLHFIITLLGALLIICVLIIVFSTKLRKANRELRERNAQIEKINSDLQKTNKDLANQKEAITREYSNTEMFYRMLVQSADDGISFFDRNINLKYANAAYYSIVGYDKEQYNKINAPDLIHPEDLAYDKNRTEASAGKRIFRNRAPSKA